MELPRISISLVGDDLQQPHGLDCATFLKLGELAMKRLLLTSAAVVLGGHAYAADLPVKMPVKASPAAPASLSWSGCYLGGNMGVARGHAGITDPNSFLIAPAFGFFAPTGGPVGVNQPGGFGGGQLGCDYEFASHWVVGLAGDFS